MDLAAARQHRRALCHKSFQFEWSEAANPSGCLLFHSTVSFIVGDRPLPNAATPAYGSSRQTPASETARRQIFGSFPLDWRHDAKEPNVEPIGSAIHRLRARHGEAVGEGQIALGDGSWRCRDWVIYVVLRVCR
jgi:hypothetical protein